MCQRRSHSPTILWAVVLIVALGLAVAAQTPAKAEPLAELDGEAIAAEEVEKAIAAQLTQLEEQTYTLKRQKVEALIAERLVAQEAAKRGITVQALLDAEVTAKVAWSPSRRSRLPTRPIRPGSRGTRRRSGTSFEPSSRSRSWKPHGKPLCNPCAPRPRSWCT
jgi:SurA N-terminal domain